MDPTRDHPRRFLLLILAFVCLVAGPAAAEHVGPPAPDAPAPSAERHAALMISPIGPLVAVIASAAGTRTFDANVRFHHVPRPGMGWTLQADVTDTSAMDMHVLHVSVRGGLRLSLRQRGLADWTLTPFVIGGGTTQSALDTRLARYGTLGIGVQIGRTWAWKRFVMELGIGVYAKTHVGFTSDVEVMAGQDAVSLSPVMPTITWSLGYAF